MNIFQRFSLDLRNNKTECIFGTMNKKFLTLSLIFVFTLSTAGLPVILHMCNITGTKSLVSCSDCKDEKKAEETESCCNTENSASNSDETSFSQGNNISCCSDQLAQIKIDDEFSIKSVDKVQQNVSVVTVVSTSKTPEKNENYFLNDSGFSPEPLYGKLLLKSIHQLKIANPLF